MEVEFANDGRRAGLPHVLQIVFEWPGTNGLDRPVSGALIFRYQQHGSTSAGQRNIGARRQVTGAWIEQRGAAACAPLRLIDMAGGRNSIRQSWRSDPIIYSEIPHMQDGRCRWF